MTNKPRSGIGEPDGLLGVVTDLTGMIVQLETFFCDQLQQLENVHAQLSQLPGRAASESAGQPTADMRAVMDEWETARDEQMRQIREDSARLIQAWQELEDEQRRMLAARSTNRASPSSASSSDIGKKVPNKLVQRLAVSSGPVCQNANSLALKQLQREVRSHGRRS